MAVENRGPALQTVCSVLVSFAVVATLLRCYVRIGIVKNFGIDDYTMVAACISFILFCTCAITGVHYGTGRHFSDLGAEDIAEAMKYWWLCYIFYCTSMIASKISIGYFLLRIAVHRLHIWIIYTVMMLTVLTGLVFFFVTLLQCNPISHFWHRDQPGSCIDIHIIEALTYLYSVFSIICDFTFAILPIALIWTLNMNRATKIALVPIMSMACVASSAVVVRLAYIKDFSDPDFLWATVDIAIWSTTEQGLAITAGSLATLRPLFRMMSNKLGFSMPSAMRASELNMPRSGAGGQGGGSSHMKSHDKGSRVRHGQYSLSDFTRHEDDVDLEAANKGTTTTYISSGKRNSVWGAQGTRTKNESEEELHRKGSKDQLEGVATLKSFLVTEERM